MDKKIKEIPIELDMKILEYASKKQFKRNENIYKFIHSIAAIIIFVTIVGGAVATWSYQSRQTETIITETEFEQLYAELTMLSEGLENKYTSLSEKLDEELDKSFAIVYFENQF